MPHATLLANLCNTLQVSILSPTGAGCLPPYTFADASGLPLQYENRNDICGILNLASWPVATLTHTHTHTRTHVDWPLNLCQVLYNFSSFLSFFCLVLGIFIISHFKKLHTRKYVYSYSFAFAFAFVFFFSFWQPCSIY